MTARIPVLEIGGTHVTAGLIASVGSSLTVLEKYRSPLDAAADAAPILDVIADAGARLDVPGRCRWGVAIPGPFDYRTGIGLFEGVAKFEGLRGVDVGSGLRARLGSVVGALDFVNDATAYALGECAAGAGRHYRRVIVLTLGTGVGSAFIANGAPVDHGGSVPPGGWMYRVEVDGAPLEETVSRRAIRDAYARGCGITRDVHQIADCARRGDPLAARVMERTWTALGRALSPWATRFRADAVVIGGSIAGSWDLIERPLRDGLAHDRIEVVRGRLGEDAPLIGAAARVVPTR